MDKEEIANMLFRAIIQQPSKPNYKFSKSEALDKMKLYFSELQKKNEFKVGDLVCSKEGLENRSPFPHGFGLVTKVLENPIISTETSSASNYFREPLDIVVGELSNSGIFHEYYMDSRRLKHYVKDNIYKL